MSEVKAVQVGKAESEPSKETYIKTRGRSNKLPQCCLPSNLQPFFYIGGGNGTALVEGPLLALGWKRITDKFDERYRLKWTENKNAINYTTFKEGQQLVNHIPNSKLLTNKLGLLCSLQEHERVFTLINARLPRMKMADFVPETYKLDQRTEREIFLNEYKDGETWICKPVGLNQGKGILLLSSRDEINRLLIEREARLKKSTSSLTTMMRVVQRYIASPLLLEGRKFDIRSYMLVASTVPFLVLYHDGYVRLSCQKYNRDDRNLAIHLTNQYVQKKDPSYADSKEDTVWTMDKLNNYINQHVAAEKQLEADWVYKTLTKQMQKIAVHCFNSVKHKLDRKVGYFDLYGMDFMVDSEMKVWLIEINTNPALQTNCQALKEAIPCVVEHALYLAIECFEKSRKGQPLMPLTSPGGYKVLYCSSHKKLDIPREGRSISPTKERADYNRQSVAGRHWSPSRLQVNKQMPLAGSSLPGTAGAVTLASSKTSVKTPTTNKSHPAADVDVGVRVEPAAVSEVPVMVMTRSQQQIFPSLIFSPASTLETGSSQIGEILAEMTMTQSKDSNHRGN